MTEETTRPAFIMIHKRIWSSTPGNRNVFCEFFFKVRLNGRFLRRHSCVCDKHLSTAILVHRARCCFIPAAVVSLSYCCCFTATGYSTGLGQWYRRYCGICISFPQSTVEQPGAVYLSGYRAASQGPGEKGTRTEVGVEGAELLCALTMSVIYSSVVRKSQINAVNTSTLEFFSDLQWYVRGNLNNFNLWHSAPTYAARSFPTHSIPNLCRFDQSRPFLFTQPTAFSRLFSSSWQLDIWLLCCNAALLSVALLYFVIKCVSIYVWTVHMCVCVCSFLCIFNTVTETVSPPRTVCRCCFCCSAQKEKADDEGEKKQEKGMRETDKKGLRQRGRERGEREACSALILCLPVRACSFLWD